MKRKHLTLNNRKQIANGIARGLKCWEIAETVGCDPTTISKEIKRNRTISKPSKHYGKVMCKKLDKYPFVCASCKHKYTTCLMTQFSYNAGLADEIANKKLINSRKGIDLTEEEHSILTQAIKNGLEEKKSLYTIIKEIELKVSLSTAYRYIDKGLIDVKKIDLPYAVTYKKRRNQNKKYEYSNNKIDRSNRTYLDYIAFKRTKNTFTTQMDFLGSIKSDSKSILTLSIVEIHFCLIFLVENKNSEKIIDIFDELERKLTLKKFKDIFGVILTDREPCFSDFRNIEFNKNGELRTRIFYCDAYRSTQKANVENLNKQLRKFFPKGKSLKDVTSEKVKIINMSINDAKLSSLDGFSPKEAFIKIFGQEAYKSLF